ncbi:hypothetical protein [Kaarinaea lacus]
MNNNPTWFLALLLTFGLSVAWAESPVQVEEGKQQPASEQGDSGVIHAFTSREVEKSDIVEIEDETKRLVMFFMGVPLLLLLIATVALGIAMVIYGKQVFVAHMVCAGLSLTLAMAHAIVGLVWFYPF